MTRLDATGAEAVPRAELDRRWVSVEPFVVVPGMLVQFSTGSGWKATYRATKPMTVTAVEINADPEWGVRVPDWSPPAARLRWKLRRLLRWWKP
ncbi:MAG: hypothetical protein ACYDAY_11550 [Candidatus Dormibacteria bacterium]